MDKELVKDEDTAASGSGSGSVITDLSILENETDDFGRRILQHERDTRRAKAQTREPFWRARPKSWVIDHGTDGQEAEAIGPRGHRRTASAGSDPPLNVPREWGKRSRRRGSWLRRHESEGNVKLDDFVQSEAPLPVDEDSIIPRRTMYTGDGWTAAQDVPRQSVETTPPSMRRLQRQHSSPSSMKHMNTTLKSEPDDDDFSALSLLTSTPAINQRSRKIDDLMKREIETVERRGVTRRTLNQISEKYSNESLRPSTAPSETSQTTRRRRSTASDKENDPAMGNKHAFLRDSQHLGLQNVTSQAVNFKNSQKSAHSRNDSMNLLKRLARVSSMSPSPEKETDVLGEAANRRASDPSSDAAGIGLLGHGSGKAISRLDKKPKVEFQLPTTSQKLADVIGLPKAPSHEPSSRLTSSLKSTGQDHPRSALEEVLKQAQDNGDEQIGESTIASLQNMVESKAESSGSKPLAGSSSTSQEPKQNRLLEPLSIKDEPQDVSSALDALTNRLQVTKATISEASRGLELIETQMAESDALDAKHLGSAQPYTDHNGRTLCEHCGGCYTSVWRGLWVEFRENFYTWDPKSDYAFRLTWLGATCLIWWSWLLLESTLCSQYCHQRYAVSMDGYGVDADAPAFPFVIPTLVFRPLRPLWRPAGIFLAWGFGVLVQALFGDRSQAAGKHSPAATVRHRGALGAQAASLSLNADPARHAARSMTAGGGWVTGAAAATATTTKRVVGSTIDAMDRFARMWEDGFGPS